MMRQKCMVFLVLLLLMPLVACNDPGAEDNETTAFSSQETYAHIEALTAEEMEGRRAGTEGNRKAKEYIKNHFSSLGLEPGGDEGSYYQWYNQQDLTFTQGASLVLLDEDGEIHKEFTNRKDFILLRRAISGESENLFRRVSLDSDFSLESSITPIGKWDINENLTIEEDSPIILGESMHMLYPLLRDHREQIEGLILLPWDPVSPFNGEPLPMYIKPAYINVDKEVMDANTPDVMYITNSTYDEILSLKDQGYTLQAKGGFTHQEVSVANVIGSYQSSEDTKDTLLLMAHFDHLGKDSDGSMNPGALDNASGTAMMMEMARVITENNVQLPFHIEFIAFNGEEDGLLGSFHYADTMDHDPAHLKVINLDMVGAKYAEHLLIDCSDRVPDESLPLLVESIIKEKDMEYRLERNSGGSDHIPFSLKGADVILLIDHSDRIFDNHYHNHYDTLDIIDKDRLELIGNILLEILEQMD